MDINYIFGVNKQLITKTKTVNDGIIIGSAQQNIATGTPCLLFENDKSKKDGRPNKASNIALFPFFSHQIERRLRTIININTNPHLIIKSLGESKFLDSIATIKTSDLVIDNMDEVLSGVREAGPVSFIVDDKKNLYKDVKLVISMLHKRFGINVVLTSSKNGRITMGAEEQMLLSFTLTDIRNCIPIFDPKKANGVVLHMATYYPMASKKNDQLISSFETTLLFSKYSENITKVDGSKLAFKTSSFDAIRDVIQSFKSDLNLVGTRSKTKPAVPSAVKNIERGKFRAKDGIYVESGGYKKVEKPSFRPEGSIPSVNTDVPTCATSTTWSYSNGTG